MNPADSWAFKSRERVGRWGGKISWHSTTTGQEKVAHGHSVHGVQDVLFSLLLQDLCTVRICRSKPRWTRSLTDDNILRSGEGEYQYWVIAVTDFCIFHIRAGRDIVVRVICTFFLSTETLSVSFHRIVRRSFLVVPQLSWKADSMSV